MPDSDRYIENHKYDTINKKAIPVFTGVYNYYITLPDHGSTRALTTCREEILLNAETLSPSLSHFK